MTDAQINLGPLSTLLADPSITEIMVNAPDKIFIEKEGQILLTNVRFPDASSLENVIFDMAKGCGRTLSKDHPYFDGYLFNGSRVNGVIPPMAPHSPVLTIRKFQDKPFTLSSLITSGTISDKGAYFLHAAMQARLNIVVSGGTGTGKTTFLNVLASLIPESERIISIEDVSELRITHPNWIRLEAVRTPDKEEISARDCLVNALRMRPDRIIVGECRRDETFEMLQAMNTGHDGSLTTIHANTPRDCFSRMESLITTSKIEIPLAALRAQIASAVNIIVQLKRQRDGKRVVHEIAEVTGMEQNMITTQSLLSRETLGGKKSANNQDQDLKATGLAPMLMDRFSEHGIQFPQSFFDPNSRVTYRPE
jgi:pilus assembly protein CpaF